MSTKKFLDLAGVSRLKTDLATIFATKSVYGDTTISLGRKTNTTIGTNSIAWGNTVTASGNNSISGGWQSSVSGDNSIAWGSYCTASGWASTAFGETAEASGIGSFAVGECPVASGRDSFATGEFTQATRRDQMVFGRGNIPDAGGQDAQSVGDYLMVGGNGEDDSDTSNALTLKWNGDLWVAGNVRVGSTSGTHEDSGSELLATKSYIDSVVAEGARKVILYNGKANNTAVLSGAIQQLSDSILNYDLIVVGFNCLVQNAGRSMEICDCIYPISSLITWCDTTGAGATGAHHIFNSNQAFNNLYRIIWGFTDATHIRNIVSAHINTGTYGWVDEGICYVVGYKFGSLPSGYATETYVDNAIASAITSAIGGSY